MRDGAGFPRAPLTRTATADDDSVVPSVATDRATSEWEPAGGELHVYVATAALPAAANGTLPITAPSARKSTRAIVRPGIEALALIARGWLTALVLLGAGERTVTLLAVTIVIVAVLDVVTAPALSVARAVIE